MWNVPSFIKSNFIYRFWNARMKHAVKWFEVLGWMSSLRVFHEQNSKGVRILDIEKLTYDFFCPAVKLEISHRICKTCEIYLCSNKNHKVASTNEHHVYIDSKTDFKWCYSPKWLWRKWNWRRPTIALEENMKST